MRFAGLSAAPVVPVGPLAVAFVRSAGFVPRGAIVVSLPVVVDALDDVVPPDGDALLADVSGVDGVDRDEAPGVAGIDGPELPDDVAPVVAPGDVLAPDVPDAPDVPIDVVPVADVLPLDEPDVDVSAASASDAPVTPIVETINAGTSLLLRRSFMCAP